MRETSIQSTDPNTIDTYITNIVLELIDDYVNSFYKNKYSPQNIQAHTCRWLSRVRTTFVTPSTIIQIMHVALTLYIVNKYVTIYFTIFLFDVQVIIFFLHILLLHVFSYLAFARHSKS